MDGEAQGQSLLPLRGEPLLRTICNWRRGPWPDVKASRDLLVRLARRDTAVAPMLAC